MSDVWVVRAGVVPYLEACEAQKRLEAARQSGAIPDVLLTLEHDPVYTKGRRSGPSELPMGEDWYRMQGIEVCESDRGGLVTYHGPGQLVAYPIAGLKPYGDDVHRFVRGIERVMIDTLAELGIEAGCAEGLTGVWTSGRKIGSIGLHVNRGVTTHGLAINVNNDLQPFEWIVPCGIEGVQMTSVCRELGERADLGTVAALLADRYAAVFERAPVPVSIDDLAERVPGLGPLAAAEPAALS
jgi:lipoyl(octanoyl) transferase